MTIQKRGRGFMVLFPQNYISEFYLEIVVKLFFLYLVYFPPTSPQCLFSCHEFNNSFLTRAGRQLPLSSQCVIALPNQN